MYKLYTKDNCTFCTQAKKLLTSKGLSFTEISDVSRELLIELFPNARTMPQITFNKEYIGGFQELKQWLEKSTAVRTIFNTKNKGYETGEYPLFLGDAPGFTDSIIQPYPVIDKIYQMQVSQIWNETEVSLTQDRMDMLGADPKTVDLAVQNLMYQTLADSAASRAITGVLLQHVTNTDLEATYNAFGLFESIHARSYLHIIKQTMIDPIQVLKDGYDNEHILKRALPIVKCFDALANMDYNAPLREKQEKVYMAIVALYLLESVSFPASFACTFAVAETGILQGVGQIVALILRDESLHSMLGREILKIDLPKVSFLQPKIKELFQEVMAAEAEWNTYLFSEGRQVVGLTPTLLAEYTEFLAGPVVETLGIDFEATKTNPLPYMSKYIDTSKVQIANQELENGTYLLNSIKVAETMDNTLAELRETHKDFL
jgi:ribonucleoside-diphosphate reductase beta chain